MNEMGQLQAITEAALRRDERASVVIVGGRAGGFDRRLEKHPRVIHKVSTEAKPGDVDWQVPAHAGVVVVTKYLSFDMSRAVTDQCRRRNIPSFGVFNSLGAVNRALAFLYDPRGDGDYDEGDLVAMPEPAEQPPVTAEPPTPAPPTPQPSTPQVLASIAQIESLFGDIEAAVQLAKEAAISAIRESERTQGDAMMLRQLRDMLKDRP